MSGIRESEQEVKQAHKVALIARRMEERKERILNSKVRAIGIQVQHLEKQVQSKREEEGNESKALEEWGDYVKNTDAAIREANRQAELQRRAHRAGLQATWEAQSKARSHGKEWDLNDPRQLAKDQVPEPERAGPSAALLYEKPKQCTKNQQREWINDKVKEIRSMREQERQEEQEHANLVREQVRLRLALDQEAASKRTQRNQDVLAVNSQLIALKQAAKERQKREDQGSEAKMREYIKSNTMLCESRVMNEQGRIVRQEWKGMTQEELQAIRQEQQRQLQENIAKREAEMARKRSEDENMERARQFSVMVENTKAQQRKEAALHTRDYQRTQSQIGASRASQQRSEDKKEYDVWFPFGSGAR